MRIEGVYKCRLGDVGLTYADTDGDGSINPSSEIISEKNYYPFGLEHKGYNNVVSSNSNSVAQNFGYNGKENNPELGLEMLDFGARNYDASLGRWMNIDSLESKFDAYSPFTYAFNSPVFFLDPDGKDVIGASGKDSDKVVNDIYTTFSDSKFDDFRGLIKRKKGFRYRKIKEINKN